MQLQYPRFVRVKKWERGIPFFLPTTEKNRFQYPMRFSMPILKKCRYTRKTTVTPTSGELAWPKQTRQFH
jgi:hypothetical protein